MPAGVDLKARTDDAFLVQTYIRDTGEAIFDLALTIFAGDERFGSLRIGYGAQE